MKRILSRITKSGMAMVMPLALILSLSTFILVQKTFAAPPPPASYSVSINTPSITGASVDLTGIASAINPVGLNSQYDVQILWGDTNTTDTSPHSFANTANGFSGTWGTDSHTYSASGHYTITAKLYHTNPTGGNIKATATVGVDVTIPPPPAPTGTLTVTKVVDNTGGGTKEVGDFQLFVDGSSVTSGVATTTSAGSHTVSEGDHTSYTSLISGDCDSETGAVNVPEGGSASCTITNTFIAPPPPSDVNVTIVKYIDGVKATSDNANSTAFHMTSTWNAVNLGSGSGNFDLDPSGFNSEGTPYTAVTSQMTSGADYSVVENDIPGSCSAEEGYSLDGYKLGDSEEEALASATSSDASLTDITSNKVIIVLNHDCSAPPPPPCELDATQTLFSDATTQVDEHDAVAVTPHPAWAGIPDATWIWSEALNENGSSPTGTKTFTKTFSLSGTPLDSMLEVAADNYYSVSVNGNPLATGDSATTLNNFNPTHTWTIPAGDLLSGLNSIVFSATNPANDPDSGEPFGDPNPAGLLFKLTAHSNECDTPPPPQSQAKVHIYKYLDNGDTTTQIPDDSTLDPFPMHASWDSTNVGTGEGDYVLGNNHGGATLRYAADTAPMDTPVASYNTYERTTDVYPDSQVLPIGADCSTDMLRLVGYKSGDSLAEAESASISETAPTYSAFSSDKYLIVVNEACSAPAPEEGGTLTIVKNTEGGNGTFDFTLRGNNSATTSVTTVDGTGSVELNINTGTSSIAETSVPGWHLDEVSCLNDSGENVGAGGEGEELFSTENGQHITCTFNNSAYSNTNGSITIQKQVVNSDGDPVEDSAQFRVCLDNNSENCQNISESSDGAFVELAPGEYTVTEDPEDGYTLQSYSEDNNNDSSNGAQVTVTSGNATTLVVVNKQVEEGTGPAHIIVHKSTNLEEGTPAEFNFTTTGEDYNQSFVLSNGESNDQAVAPGTYTITEGGDFPGWQLNSVICEYDGNPAGGEAPHGHEVTLGAGDTVVCTFNNHYNNSENEGHLIVKKVLVNAPENASPSDFSFVINDGDPHNFDSDGENDITLNSGTYTVTESAADGYVTTYDNCDNLEIGNGETETCTITNTVPTPPTGGGGGGGGAAPQTGGFGGGGGGLGTQGQVLGTSTGPTIDTNPGELPTCSTSFITTYMGYGRRNNSEDVKRLQIFLNEFQNAGLPVTGFFGRLTLAAVKAFQISQEQYIRGPWNNAGVPITNAEWPSGYVYKTTLWRINAIKCTSLNAPVPQLP